MQPLKHDKDLLLEFRFKPNPVVAHKNLPHLAVPQPAGIQRGRSFDPDFRGVPGALKLERIAEQILEKLPELNGVAQNIR